MNTGQRTEIKAEVLMKAFSRYCIEEARKQQVSKGQQDDFLLTCIERMTALANRADKASFKP